MGRPSARYAENVSSGCPERPVQQKSNPRDLWTPKRSELAQQCASCPFRKGNDAEFGVIVDKLNRLYSSDGTVEQVRFSVEHSLEHGGDFACHLTAYTETMGRRPPHEHRQCPGATAAFKAAGVVR